MSTPNPIKIPSITQAQLIAYRAALGGNVDGLMYIPSDGVNAGNPCRDIAGIETPLSTGGGDVGGREWSPVISYLEGDMVNYQGASYRAANDSLNVEPGTDPTLWAPMVIGGRAWDAFIPYLAGDIVVTNDGIAWVAQSDNINEPPSDLFPGIWDTLANTAIPHASTTKLGVLKVDGVTLTVDIDGVVSTTGGGGTLQDAYDAGPTITVATSTPVSLSHTTGTAAIEVTNTTNGAVHRIFGGSSLITAADTSNALVSAGYVELVDNAGQQGSLLMSGHFIIQRNYTSVATLTTDAFKIEGGNGFTLGFPAMTDTAWNGLTQAQGYSYLSTTDSRCKIYDGSTTKTLAWTSDIPTIPTNRTSIVQTDWVVSGAQPFCVAVDPVTDSVFIGNNSAGTISRSTYGGAINTTWSAGHSSPTCIAMHPTTSEILMMPNGGTTVKRIALSTGTIASTDTVGATATTIGLYVMLSGDYFCKLSIGTLTKVTNGGSVTLSFATGLPTGAGQGSLNVAQTKLVLPGYSAGTVVEVDTSSGAVTTFKTGLSSPTCAAYSPTGEVWVACEGTDDVKRYDSGGTLLATYTVVVDPQYITFDGDGNAVVACSGSNRVSLINATTGIVDNVPIVSGGTAYNLAINPDNQDIIVPAYTTTSVSRIARPIT